MTAPEPSYLSKLHWARCHTNELDVQIRRWLEVDDHVSTRAVPDPKCSGYFLVKASVKPIPANPISLILGDAIQNLRSSLDHIALELARRNVGALTEAVEAGIQFPIISEIDPGQTGKSPADLFGSRTKKTIGSIDPDARMIIERLQPYNRGANYKSDLLWVLRELSNIDKHRALHLAGGFQRGIEINKAKTFNVTIKPGQISVYEGRVETDTVIARIPMAPTKPGSAMHLHCEPTLFIVFAEGPAAGKDIVATLRDIHHHLEYVVFPGLARHLS